MASYGFDNRRPWFWVILPLIGVTILFLALLTPVFAPLQQTLLKLAAPLHASGLAVRVWLVGRSDCPATAELQSRLDELNAENARLRSIAEENSALRSAAGYRAGATANLLTARVVHELGDNHSRRLLIDHGRDSGLKVGQPVITESGLLVGKLIAVGVSSSEIMPVTDSRSRLAAMIQGSQNTMGVLEGERGAALTMNLIPKSDRVAIGDTVVTSGLEEGVRRGLAVGVVDKVLVSTQDPFQSAIILPFANIQHPLIVQVIRQEAPPVVTP